MATLTQTGAARRARSLPWPALGLAAIVLLGAFLLWTQAIRVGNWSNDEDYFVQISRLLAENFPSAIWDLPVNEFDERGFQRMTVLLLALPLSAINGETGLELARALMCLGFASAAIPAYLLARGIGLAAGWSLAAALLVVLVPWATLTSTFLTESVAYTTALWALYGAWRATVGTGIRVDLLALVLAFGAGFARTNLLVLAGVAPTAVALRALATAGPGGLRTRAPRAARSLVREHPLLTGVLVLGFLVVVANIVGIQPGPVASLSGSYVTSLTFDPSPLPGKFSFQLSRMLSGLGILPGVLGTLWLLRHLGRRGTPAEQGFAAVAAVAFALILLSTVYAAPEERYLIALAPPFVIAAIAALARRDLSTRALVAGGVLAGVLLARQTWAFVAEPTLFVTDPAAAFLGRVAAQRLDPLPGSPSALVGLVCALLVVALAVAWRRGTPRTAARVAIVALAGIVLVQAAQTAYLVRKHAELSGGAPLVERAWIDETVGEEPVALQATGLGNTSTYQPIWRELAFWNRRADVLVSAGPLGGGVQIPRYGSAVEATVDERTGRLRSGEGEPFPRWFAAPMLFRSLGLAGDAVRQSEYLPLELVRLRGAPRATFSWAGPEVDGWLTDASPTAEARVFPAARESAADACLVFTLVPPGNARRPHRYTVAAAGFRRDGAVTARQTRVIEVPLRSDVRRVRVTARGSVRSDDGRRLSLQLVDTRVGGCSS